MFIGGPGTGKTHLASALAVSGITTHNKRVQFFSTVDLVNLLEREKYDGKAGRIAQGLCTFALLNRNVSERGKDSGYVPYLDRLIKKLNPCITSTRTFIIWTWVSARLYASHGVILGVLER